MAHMVFKSLDELIVEFAASGYRITFHKTYLPDWETWGYEVKAYSGRNLSAKGSGTELRITFERLARLLSISVVKEVE